MDLSAFPVHWEVRDPVLIADTFGSRIWKVRLREGRHAVVKALQPFDDVQYELRGAHYLAWPHGEGAVRLPGCEGQSRWPAEPGRQTLSRLPTKEGARA